MSKWKILQIIQLVIVIIVSLFLLFRSVDGHGAIQTAEAKTISLIVWLGFYLFILVIEIIIYFITKKSFINR